MPPNTAMTVLCISGNMSVCNQELYGGQSAVLKQSSIEGKIVIKSLSPDVWFAVIGTSTSDIASQRKILKRDNFWKMTPEEIQFGFNLALFDFKKAIEEGQQDEEEYWEEVDESEIE